MRSESKIKSSEGGGQGSGIRSGGWPDMTAWESIIILARANFFTIGFDFACCSAKREGCLPPPLPHCKSGIESLGFNDFCVLPSVEAWKYARGQANKPRHKRKCFATTWCLDRLFEVSCNAQCIPLACYLIYWVFCRCQLAPLLFVAKLRTLKDMDSLVKMHKPGIPYWGRSIHIPVPMILLFCKISHYRGLSAI